MIANLSPCISASENTLNTLRYADRVKEMKKADKTYHDPLMLPRAQPSNQAKNPR